ncbi:MAG: LacI family DNA-binding transcriptional regulator [Janthinobacterium lividum]
MKPSIRQVAEYAQVSHATVSRVLNNVDVRIAPETRLRVERVAAELGYQPNRNARALVTGRTQTIALWATNLRSAYYGEFIHYIHEEITRHDYDLIVSGAKASEVPGDAGVILDTSKLLSWPVDGILAVDLPRGTIPGLNNSLIGSLPFVNVGGYVVECADFVRVDFTEPAAEAVRHLSEVGCRRIAYLVPDWFEWFQQANDPRLCGYISALTDLGLEPEYILVTDAKRECVKSVLSEYVKQHGCPDGIFCYNDDLAIGALALLRDLGMTIPDDVALIGCDGIQDTDYFSPSITTIVQPLEQMCTVAWSLLKQRIEEPSLPLQQVILTPRLEVRGSSKRSS